MSYSLTDLRSTRVLSFTRTIAPEITFAVIVGSVVFAAVLWLPGVLVDPDTPWHIVAGGWILAHHAVPHIDTYSLTRAGKPWFAQEWLAEVIMTLAYRWAGWSGLMIMTACAAGVSLGLLGYYLRRHTRVDIAVMLILLAIGCAAPSLLSRPHIVALPFMILWMIALVSARRRHAGPPWIALPVMTVWANLHGGFLLGLGLAGAFAVESLIDPECDPRTTLRLWSLFFISACVAAIITPNGIGTLIFPFHLLGIRDLNQIQEWQPTTFSHLTGATVSLLLALYIGLSGKVRFPKFRALMFVGLAYAMMQHGRFMQVFGVLVPLLIADPIGVAAGAAAPFHLERQGRTLIGLFGAAAILSLGLRIALPFHRPNGPYFDNAALKAVPAALRSKPVLNEYGFGGFLIFHGIRPFIDGRADLYGDHFIDTYMAIIGAKGDMLDEVLCRYNIQWTIFSPDSVVPALMDRTPGWHRIYSDQYAVIHARQGKMPSTSCSSSPPDSKMASAPAP